MNKNDPAWIERKQATRKNGKTYYVWVATSKIGLRTSINAMQAQEYRRSGVMVKE